MIPVAEDENADDRSKTSKRAENGNARTSNSSSTNPPALAAEPSQGNYIISYNDFYNLAGPTPPPHPNYPNNMSAFHFVSSVPHYRNTMFDYNASNPNAHYPNYNVPSGFMHPSEQQYDMHHNPHSPRIAGQYPTMGMNYAYPMAFTNPPSMHHPSGTTATGLPFLPRLDISHGHVVHNRANSFDSTMASVSLSSPRAASRAMSTSSTPMARSNSNQNLSGSNHNSNSNTSPNNSNHSNNNLMLSSTTTSSALTSPNARQFDPLSIREKSIPAFLEELFRPLIENQIQHQTPLAKTFPDAHFLLKNVLVEKNIKDSLISYRTDTKRAKRDYRIKNFRVTLITGRDGIYFFSFGEIVPQHTATNSPDAQSNSLHPPPPPQGSGSSKSKKRRNTEDSLSSRKSTGNKSSSSTDPPNDSYRDSEPMIFNRNTSRDQFEEDIAEYDLIHLESDGPRDPLLSTTSYSDNNMTSSSNFKPALGSMETYHPHHYSTNPPPSSYPIQYGHNHPVDPLREPFEPNKHRRMTEDGLMDEKEHQQKQHHQHPPPPPRQYPKRDGDMI